MESENGLPMGWEARLGLNGRIYYYSKRSQIVQILPPPETWRCKYCLPYGWEMAVDYDHKSYYINHVTQTVTYEDPRTEDDQTIPVQQLRQKSLPPPDLLLSPQPREYLITRDPRMGFGFIAGSEKPVIIRSVSAGGPSEGKLLADDQILKVGSENVMQADREEVIQLIRDKPEEVSLTVLQPNRSANSSFLNPAKKTFRTMDRPKVRFADDVIVNGQQRVEGSSPLLMSPGVLKVELENGETRSFRFEPDTTAGDAVAALCEQLGFKDPNLFSLVIASPMEIEDDHGSDKSAKSSFSSTASEHSLMTSSSPESILIAPWDTISKVVNNPSARHHYCYLRLEFMPRDFHKLARHDAEAFRYLYIQCVNDVVAGDRYKNDLTHEDLVKLAVLQMQELVLSRLPSTPLEKRPSSSSSTESPMQKNSFRFPGMANKLTLKYFEKEYGLRRFLPSSVLDAMKKDTTTAKSIKKMIQQFLKASYSTPFLNQNPTSPIILTSPVLLAGGNTDTALFQLRLQYLKVLSPQHLFGGRFFSVSMLALMESDIAILVGHHYGISQLINTKTRMVSVLAEFQQVKGLEVAPCRPESRTTRVNLQFTGKKDLQLSMDQQDAHNFAFMVAGYCRVYGNNDMVLTLPMDEATSAPVYFGPHKVKSSHWNYPASSETSMESRDLPPPPSFFYCDFSEPITPSLLSQDTPPLTNFVEKNIYPRPPTPPPTRDYPVDEEEEEVFIETRLQNGDSNNNGSTDIWKRGSDVIYEEIVTSSQAQTSTVGNDIYFEHTAHNANDVRRDPSDNGSPAPSPSSQRATRVSTDSKRDTRENIERNAEGQTANELITDEVVTKYHYIASSPPDYPTPRRKEISESVAEEEKSSNAEASGSTVSSDPNSQFHSFKSSSGTSRSASPASETDRKIATDTEDSRPLENFQDVKDPATIQKLQETEDLIQYFRKKHQEIVGASSDGSMPYSAGEFGSPIVVSDIAAGNKRLRRAEKAAVKNRKSWAGVDNANMVEDDALLSMSTPDLSTVPQRKKRNRNIFRKIFGERRKKPLSMYDVTSSSAYGRRKRRFRMPRFRFKKAFSLHSSGKSHRKSVLPDAESRDKSPSSRFRPFSSKKGKSYDMLVISEPSDGVRGVDLLPKGKYTVAGTMFNGDARESAVITFESKENSLENLNDIGVTNDPQSSLSAAKVTLRPSGGSIRVSKRPVSFSTFQQTTTNHNSPVGASMARITEDDRSKSVLLVSDRLSPCELSQTESTEALHEIAPIQEKIVRSIIKPPRKLMPAHRTTPDVIPMKLKSHCSPHVNQNDSTDSPSVALTKDTGITKRPSYKRPAPLPPVAAVKQTVHFQEENEVASQSVSCKYEDDSTQETSNSKLTSVQIDSEDESRLFDPKSDDSMSLVTEIFSYLKSNGENGDLKISELPEDAQSQSNDNEAETTLLYDQSCYSMPGVKSDSVMKVQRIEKDFDKDKVTDEQRALYEMFYDEMIADNSRLTLGDPESDEQDASSGDCDSDASEEERRGSYDVTVTDDSDENEEDQNDDTDGITLKYYAMSDKNNVAKPNSLTAFNGFFNHGSATSAREKIAFIPKSSGGSTESESHTNDGTDSCCSSSSGSTGNVNNRPAGSYSSYGNLISPSGYSRGIAGVKRTPLSPRPPLPPKPLFH